MFQLKPSSLTALSAFLCVASASAAEIIDFPRYPGTNLTFSHVASGTNGQSDENGICVALGFNRAIPGSARSDYAPYPYSENIQVDYAGNPIGAPTGYRVSQIICGERVHNTRVQPQLVEVISPRDRGTQRPFSFTGMGTNGASSENGICRAIGYASAIAGSSRNANEPYPYSANFQVDEYGTIIGAPQGWSTSRIICVANPTPVGCPNGYVWDGYNCVPIVVTPPPVVTPPAPINRCPDPNTVWDARLGRCVSRATPPRPVQIAVTCSIYNFSVTLRGPQNTRPALTRQATQQVLRQCAANSGGYVCAGSQVRCR